MAYWQCSSFLPCWLRCTECAWPDFMDAELRGDPLFRVHGFVQGMALVLCTATGTAR